MSEREEDKEGASDQGDNSSSSSSSSSSSCGGVQNLVLVQVYIETGDYLLRVDEDSLGVSMHANRDIGRDEKVFRDPVGPRESNERIALASLESGTTAMDPGRRAFMERFLVWQGRYGSGTFVGGTKCDVPVFSEEDFAARPSPDPRDDDDEPIITFPTPDNPSYFFSLLDGDYVIVEFVPREDAPTEFPEHRRFEVLGYDEAIHWDGEEGYDPQVHRRPPAVWTSGDCSRYLELPGHYTNHACGEAATAYDTCRLALGEEEGREGVAAGGGRRLVAPAMRLVAPAMSAEYNAQLRERADGVEPEEGTPLHDAANVMTARRAMRRGEEILTDYGLWHWSNQHYAAASRWGERDDDPPEWKGLPQAVRDAASSLGITGRAWNRGDDVTDLNYTPFEELPPDQQGAARTIGYTPESWNDVAEELKPWFRCLCGGSGCHSRDGFRGAKFFPLEVQTRDYWLYGPYMRQQIDWKMYQHNELVEKRENST